MVIALVSGLAVSGPCPQRFKSGEGVADASRLAVGSSAGREVGERRISRTARGSGSEVYQARRLDVVRIFAWHLQPLDLATEIPPGAVLARRPLRIPPTSTRPRP